MRQRFFIDGAQSFNGRIGIRRRLKVRKKVFALAISHPHPRDALIDLAKNTRARQPAARAEAAVVAKRTAARRDCPIHIRTRKTGVDADLLHTSAKSPL